MTSAQTGDDERPFVRFYKGDGMKPRVAAVLASVLLFAGCNNGDKARREDFEGQLPSKGAFDGPESKGEQVYGLFLKSAGGKIRFETVHGPFSDLDACQAIANAYNNGTYDARSPGVHTCEAISGSVP